MRLFYGGKDFDGLGLRKALAVAFFFPLVVQGCLKNISQK
jgi:hypothetical protein